MNNSRPEFKNVSFTFTGTRHNHVPRTSRSQTPVFPSPPCAGEATLRARDCRQGGAGPGLPTKTAARLSERQGATPRCRAPRSTAASGCPDFSFHWAGGFVHNAALLPSGWAVIGIWIAEVLQQPGNSLGLHSKRSIYSGRIKNGQTLRSSSHHRGSLLLDLLVLG